MFCISCGGENLEGAKFCDKCGAATASIAAAPIGIATDSGSKYLPNQGNALPEGVKGWSWGAFLLNWIWAIGNRTWWGLLAIIPYVGVIVAIYLGFKGREMAWRNRKWDDIEHFNRVQKKWSKWGVGIVVVTCLVGVLAAIALPAYQQYVERAHAAEEWTASAKAVTVPVVAAASSAPIIREPENTARSDELWMQRLVLSANEINKTVPSKVDEDTQLDIASAGPGRKFTYHLSLPNISIATVDKNRLNLVFADIKAKMCENINLREFFQNRTSVIYAYSDQGGTPLGEVKAMPSDCGY